MIPDDYTRADAWRDEHPSGQWCPDCRAIQPHGMDEADGGRRVWCCLECYGGGEPGQGYDCDGCGRPIRATPGPDDCPHSGHCCAGCGADLGRDERPCAACAPPCRGCGEPAERLRHGMARGEAWHRECLDAVAGDVARDRAKDERP